ncbi:O-antigen ligase family protein [Vibrio sp. NTOU-M3]|uniref:O-antigen ligase family protein n=1 Tax=Vibrio sp. NTOU-M3 TaxID=3234954 RepID=UPI00349FA41D
MNSQDRAPAIYFAIATCLLISAGWYFVPHPAVSVVLCMAPLGILFVLSQTFWLVTLFVLFSFFRIHEAIPVLFPLKIPLLLSLGALSALMWHALISRKLQIYWHHSLSWLAAFWLLVMIGVVLSSNPALAIQSFKNTYWKIMLMTLAIVWLVNSEKNLSKASVSIVLTGVLIAGVALFNSANGIGLVEGSRVTIGRQLGSILGDPNDLSLVLMFPLAFSLSLAFSKDLGFFIRLLGVIASLMLVAAVIATQSRGGLLGCLSVFGIFTMTRIKSKALLISLGVIAGLALFAMAGVSDRASGGAAEDGIDQSAMGRLYAWGAAYRMALDNPLTGVGLNNFYSNYFYYSTHWDGLNHAVHSTWFGVLAETGFLGLFVFVAMIVSLIKTSRNTISTLQNSSLKLSPFVAATAYAVYAGLIGTIVSGTFLTQGFTWPIYILAALTVAVARIVQIESQNENQRYQKENKPVTS